MAMAVALVLATAGLFTTAPAQSEYPTGPEAGKELAQEIRDARPLESMHSQGTLKIKKANRPARLVPITSETTVTATNWMVTYDVAGTDQSGAEKLTVIFTTNAPNVYLYARAEQPGANLGAAKTVHPADTEVPLAGSDFWLSDLGFEFYHWPQQDRKPGQMRSGRPCFVLESVDPNPKPGGYAKVVTFIEKESGQPLIAEAYGVDRKLMKSFKIGSVEKVNGRYQVKDMRMENAREHSYTELDFDSATK